MKIAALLARCVPAMAAIALTIGVWSPASAQTPRGILKFGADTPLNDWETFNKPGEAHLALVYEPLIGIAADGHTLQPKLATKWEQTATAVTLTLRSGVTFHDGTPFNAQAAAINIERIKASKSQFANIFKPVSAVKAVNDTTLVLELNGPAPTLLRNLNARGTMMVSPKALADGSYLKQGIGTGPWKFNAAASQFGANSKIVAEYYDGYYAPEQVGPRRVEVLSIDDPNSMYNALVTGQIDVAMLPGDIAKPAEAQGFKVVTAPSLLMHLLMLDRKDTFANVNVRRAICSAIDTAEWVEADLAGYGKSVVQRFQPGEVGHNPDLKPHGPDLAKARAFMAAAGNPKVSFTIPIYARVKQRALLLKSQLAPIGIDVNVEQMTAGQYFTFYQTNKYPVQINTSASEDPGPYDYYQFRLQADGVGNPFKVQDAGLDALVQKTLASDPKEQEAGWRAMAAYVHDNALDCGFFEHNTVWAFNAKRVDKVVATAMKPSVFRYAESRPAN